MHVKSWARTQDEHNKPKNMVAYPAMFTQQSWLVYWTVRCLRVDFEKSLYWSRARVILRRIPAPDAPTLQLACKIITFTTILFYSSGKVWSWHVTSWSVLQYSSSELIWIKMLTLLRFALHLSPLPIQLDCQDRRFEFQVLYNLLILCVEQSQLSRRQAHLFTCRILCSLAMWSDTSILLKWNRVQHTKQFLA